MMNIYVIIGVIGIISGILCAQAEKNAHLGTLLKK